MSGMLSLSTLLTVSACLSYVALIYLVLSGGGTRQVKLLFTAYLVGIFAMQAGLFLVTISTDPGKVKIFYDTTAAGFVFFVGLFYPIVVYFTGSKIRKLFLVLSLSFTVVAAGVCLSGACFQGLYMGSSGFLVPNIRLSVLILVFPVLFLWISGMQKLVRQYFRTHSVYLKNRMKYPLLGSIVLFAGAFSNLTFLKEYPVDIVFYLIHAVVFGYAVIKQRVVDVKLALRKGLFVCFTVFFLLGAHYLLTRAVESLLSEYFSTTALSVFSFFILILLFACLCGKRIGPVVVGLFSRTAKDRQHLLTQYSRVILPAVHPERIYKELENVLLQVYELDFFSMYVVNGRKSGFELEYFNAEGDRPVQTGFITKDHPFFRGILEKSGPVWIEELITGRMRENVQAFLCLFPCGLEPEIVVPLGQGKGIDGFFCFREKNRRKIYVQEDFILFSIMATLTSAGLFKAKVFEDLEKNLKEKDLLLKEVHHRVKNNLQLISSMLELQKSESDREEIIKLFTESQNRINSIAHVHESIYISDSLSKINSREYIESLTADIRSQYDRDGRVQIILELEDLFFDISQAIPLGLIINELITNAFKHAFTNERLCALTIQTRRKNGQAVCRIKDNGSGFDIHAKRTSLGLTIVETLATGQLEGEWKTHVNDGTEHIIAFPYSNCD
jgi:two-component sensor histidine kinase